MEHRTPARPIRFFGISLAVLAVLLLLSPLIRAGDLFGWLLPDIVLPSFYNAPVMNPEPFAPDSSWFVTSLYALALNLSIVAACYVLSGVLGPRLRAWAKTFGYNLTKSALIVCFIFISFHLANDNNAIYHVGLIQVQSAYNFAVTIRNSVTFEFGSLLTLTGLLSTIGNITPYFKPAGIMGFSFSFAPAFRPVFDALGVLLSLMVVSVGEWGLQSWLLIFIQTRMLTILLPVGLFLRTFGMERPGNALIAIAVGFYFVYPFMLNVNSYAVNQYFIGEFGSTQIVQDATGMPHTYEDCVNATPNTTRATAGCIYKLQLLQPINFMLGYIRSNVGASAGTGLLVQFFTGSILGTFLLSFALFFGYLLIKVSVFYVLVVSVLMPLFDLFVTVTVIKELSGFLGTQMDFSAFEKLL